MKIYIENESYWKHIFYTMETIFRCIHLHDLEFIKSKEYAEGNHAIYYGRNMPQHFKGIFIKEGNFFGTSYLKRDGMPKLPLKRYKDIPILFMDSYLETPDIIKKEHYTEINFDLIQSAFFIITGSEEIINRNETFDAHSRYLIENRILYKEKFLHKPLINIYASILQDCLFNYNLIENQKKPPIAYAHISHDVDWPYARKSKLEKKLSRIPGVEIKRRADIGFDIILQTEQEYDIHSSWFIKSGGSNLGYDRQYDMQDPIIKQIIQRWVQKGDEVGWHYSYNAAFDPIQFRKEYDYFIESTGFKTVYGRNHYLRYMIPETWRMYSDLGMLYDTTLASAQHEGFVFGICTPFQLFDAVLGENLNVWEIPLIVMEGTVCSKVYRGMEQEEVMQTVSQLVKEVQKYGGVFSLLWHNTSFQVPEWRVWEDTYDKLMKFLSDSLVCEMGEQIINAYR